MEAKAPINKTLYRSYRGELSKLTFNSKPIINDLSKRATANVDDAETILKAIEDHLRFSVPNLKLPAFYLLDSIIKNVGGMYMDLLYGRLERIFVDVWKTVDAEVRAKMERTLNTWRNGFEGGRKNLFPEFVLRKIEEDVAKLKARATGNVAVVPVADGGVDLLDSLTSMQSYAKKRAQEERKQAIEQAASARAGAYDAAAAKGGDSRALHPPKRQRTPDRAQGVVNQGLLQEVDKVIKKKRVELLRRPNDVVLFGVISKLNSIKEYVTVASDLPRYRINEIRDQLVYLESDVVDPPVQALRDVSLEGSDASQLLSSLMARPDLVSSLAKVAPELSTSLGALMAPAHQSGAPPQALQVEPIPMTQASIARKRAGIHNALYQGGYPRQCSQCGWRAQDSEEGKARMNEHLDWHFRRNLRTQSEQVRKAPMRGWYVEQGVWEAPLVAEAEVSEEKVNKEIEPMEEVTVAVTDNNEPCAVCRESFERKFIEEDEAWVLVNAVRVGDRLYHATCQHPAS
ncbi:mRNA 3' end processing factor [Coemansia sp. RSA 2050]|nr:mRNA 3' end processing factor [Coemansia sp. RSA 2050]KAJ2729359.1 mRNA 3' end processing factor [Coemansia sp. BCRC 34962]